MNRFNMIGFMSALISTIVGVWQSVYVKMLMRLGLEKNYVRSVYLLRTSFTGPMEL